MFWVLLLLPAWAVAGVACAGLCLAAVRAACAELARRGKAADAQRCEISDGAGRVLATVALRDAARPH